ncbi:archaemetzincin family Zn-dependent metalloprotease [Thermodesulfobacteriota bacterium]
MNAGLRHSFVISPATDCESELFAPIVKSIKQVFRHDSLVTPLIRDVGFALDPNRGQYHSTLILEKLAEMAPEGAVKVIALTRVDLFIPILTHVYGEAQLGGKACIVSTFRLKENLSPLTAQQTYIGRVVKEVIHELGHTFNLRHCPDSQCIMHYCRSIKDVDQKSDQLCRYCRVLIDDELRRMARG